MQIVITHPNPLARQRWIDALRAQFPAARVDSDPDSRNEPTQGADYAVGWTPPAGDFFTRHPGLKAFFSSGAGVDHLLSHAGLPAALPVIRLEDAGMARQMTDYCVHEVLRLYYGHGRYEQQQRAGLWAEHVPPARSDFVIGVFGLGVLGAHVARTLHEMGFVVQGYARTARVIPGVQGFFGDAALTPFLTRSKVLIVLAPLTPSTRGLFNAGTLSRLPPGAWFINVARGGLVVDADLLGALDQNHLAGATLDVFAQEPLPAGHPWWTHPKVRVTPHIAALTLVPESAEQVAAKIRALEHGAPVGGLVDRQRGY